MKIECSVVRDLLPLYVEDMVREDTVVYVSEHLDGCHECQEEYDSLINSDEFLVTEKKTETVRDDVKPFKKVMKRVNRQMYSLSYAVIIIFIFLGFSLTGGQDLMYNSIIMPVVGVFGYIVFRWKAVFKVPVLLLIINLIAYGFKIADIDFASVFPWTFIYSIFVLVGVAIAFLLHFAFRKE